MPSPKDLSTLLLPLALFAALGQARAQTAPVLGHREPAVLRSGVRANPSPVDGVVWREFLVLPDQNPWIRVLFRSVELEGDSHLRVVSLRDGDVQTLSKKSLEQWNLTTAYFNGNAVMIELVAAAGTQKNLVEIDEVLAGDLIADVPPPETICGTTDNRTPSSDPRVGRIVGIGCSGWIISNQVSATETLHLSAGHCYATNQVLQFNVPASTSGCSLQMPSSNFQFSIDSAGSIYNNGGVGNDYWVFRCFPNSNTGQTTFQTMNAAFTLASAMPGAGTTVVNWGYGVDGTATNNGTGSSSCSCSSPNGARSQTQQTSTGPMTSTSGTAVYHQCDTCGGNSGSVVANNSNQQAIAIHTHGGCGSTSGSNASTAVTHPAVQTAITQLSGGGGGGGGGGAPANDACANAVTLAAGLNGPFSSVGATPGSAFSCVTSGSNDVWFQYAATAAGTHTFSLCGGSLSFDSVLEAFTGTCSNLTSIGCNDDTCSLGSSITVTLSAGQSCLIHVGGYNGATGSFDVDVSAPVVTTPGDECATAAALTIGTNGPFNNASSTASTAVWSCGGGTRRDLWHSFVAPCTAPATFSTCTTARTFDTVLQVFSGSCSNLVSLGCNDDACGLGSSLTVNLIGGQTYYVRVGGYNGATGAYELVAECGTGTGSMTTAAHSCNGPTLSVTGAPRIFSTLNCSLTGAAGLPFVGYGVGTTPAPFCGCTIGHSWDASFFGPNLGLSIPCDAALIGVSFGIQGLDLGGTGGCPSPQFTVSDTVYVTIG